MLNKSITCLMFTALMSFSASAAVSLSIKGLEGALKKNVDAYLSAIPEDDYSTSLRFRSRVEERIENALKALGYYNPDISFVISEDETSLTALVNAGDPVLLQVVDIKIEGEAAQDAEFIKLKQSTPLKVGGILNHSQYEALKTGFRNLALAKGYFDGDFEKKSLEVAPTLNQGFIFLHYKSGHRYKFGKTRFAGSQIEQGRLHSLIPYDEGDEYLASKVGLFNQRLSNTDWFSSVFVQPDTEHIGKNRELPMLVNLAPESKNQIETGLGYSTDVGVRGTLNWKKPWVNSKGHSFDSSLSISEPEQIVTLGYQIPLEDVLNDYYRLEYGMKSEDNNDTDSLESSLSVERHWQLESGWHRTASIRYLHEDFTQGLQDDDIEMILPGISFSRTKTSGGPMPRKGDKQSVTFEVSDKNLVSRARMVRVLGRIARIRSFGEKHRWLGRVDLNANFIEQIEDVPPSIRFFAGGDNSIRGYDYESISPTDESGALIGAKYMAAGSLEYQYNFSGNWWGATFIDYGDAWSDEVPDGKKGAGFGIRWVSPVGPVRLDFAWGLDADPGDRFRLHFTLGPEL
ncbi:autotransporter assembly complex protein TamA [Vibrio sp. JC009]|uniref:autotransporter assembly complex protein TamA n=1 Tax=Vibrio sp. JC009 TaxID=2912314 RepID=UPI0023B192C2|nr:autotransporter assembly complex family protein [Vibrio sp. JC009]WED22125.1 autotransporter assembly complex protein TamA [Vibrio sp. JC009]